jgi:chaperonin GroEL
VRKQKTPVQVSSGNQVRQALVQGVATLARVVGATYGPHGRTVALDRAAGLLTTKDGVAVAWEVNPAYPLERIGTRVAQEACSKVNKSVGDGTTTTAILVHALVVELNKWIAAGYDPNLLSRLVRKELGEIENFLVQELWHPGEDREVLLAVATTACNGDVELADAIVEAINSVGVSGMVSVEDGKSRGVEVLQKRGLEFDWGYESLEMADQQGNFERRFDLPIVALVDAELTEIGDVQTILEEATQFPHPLVIVSRGCRSHALRTLVSNDRKLELTDGRMFECVAIRVPGHLDQKREHLEDLAALTGATIIDPLINPLSKFESSMFGSAQTSSFSRRKSTFVAFEDNYDLIVDRVGVLEARKTRLTSSHDLESLNERIARLSEGFCLLRIGGVSDLEIRERRGRVEDALSAVRATIEEGIVPGGTLAYLALSFFLEKRKSVYEKRAEPTLGLQILAEALKAPFRTLVRNSGKEPAVLLNRVVAGSQELKGTSYWVGWDPLSEAIRDFQQHPRIFDPLRVVRTVIEVSVSSALTLTSIECALTLTK